MWAGELFALQLTCWMALWGGESIALIRNKTSRNSTYTTKMPNFSFCVIRSCWHLSGMAIGGRLDMVSAPYFSQHQVHSVLGGVTWYRPNVDVDLHAAHGLDRAGCWGRFVGVDRQRASERSGVGRRAPGIGVWDACWVCWHCEGRLGWDFYQSSSPCHPDL